MDVIVMHANSEKMPLKIRACHLEQMRRQNPDETGEKA